MLGLIKFKNPISWLKLYPVITGVYHGIIVGVLKPLGTLGLIIQYHGLSILIPQQHPTATSPDLGTPDGRWTKKNQQEKPGTGIALKMAVRRSTIRFWVTSFVSCLSMFMYSMILVCLQSVLVLPFCLKAEFCDSWVWSQLWSLFIELFSSLSKSCGHFFSVWNCYRTERTGENHCSLHHSWHVPTIILQSSCMRLVPSIFGDGRSTRHIGLVGNDPSVLGCALKLAVSN